MLKEKEIILSVVVPVYNMEKYLDRCISSLVNQTYKNIEIIIIDDGSIDKSLEICKKWEEKDKRIKVIHKTNRGLSATRNEGIKNSKGKYITFVDSDDWISRDIYEYCINLLLEKKVEIIDFSAVYVKDDKGNINYSNLRNTKYNEIKGKKSILYNYLDRAQKEIMPFSVCRKIYSKTLFDDIEFPVGKQNEDIVTNFKLLAKIDKIIITNKIGYYYFQNEVSITNGILKVKDLDLLDVCYELYDITLKFQDKKIIKLAQIKLARSYFSLLAKGLKYGFSKEREIEGILVDLIKKLRKNYCLLITSSIPFSRKIMVTLFCINYNFLVKIKHYLK